jgi:[ribosomal protein S18]-alanine N-acetyltransferase
MLIREATPADISDIMALAQRSDTAAHWGSHEYNALFAPEAPRRLALVAEEMPHATLPGFAIVRCMNDEWELENIAVAPERQRQGIARRIMNELLARARQAKVAAMLLEVRESNAAARQLYAELGFIECGRRRGYYATPPGDALLLRRELQICDIIP